ncbi:hypothetical protein V8J88_15575 [Massilia sp. W12]|uniref:hypothetical protein n=1 Tax=Massilia sp. W12 TaxID=3126507 RepID=UPI0030D366B8
MRNIDIRMPCERKGYLDESKEYEDGGEGWNMVFWRRIYKFLAEEEFVFDYRNMESSFLGVFHSRKHVNGGYLYQDFKFSGIRSIKGSGNNPIVFIQVDSADVNYLPLILNHKGGKGIAIEFDISPIKINQKGRKNCLSKKVFVDDLSRLGWNVLSWSDSLPDMGGYFAKGNKAIVVSAALNCILNITYLSN